MKKLHIVTDSMCHIPHALCQELEIDVIPLPYVWDNKTYFDNIDMSPREFYKKLRKSKSIPTTSGPPPGLFVDKFRSLSKDKKPILAILVGSVFSSTYNAANLAKNDLPDIEITTIDSKSNSMGLGFQVLAAARAVKKGKGLNEVISITEKVRDKSGVVFSVPDLKYLSQGGRISHLQHLVGSTLNLVPIMEINQGPIKLVRRVRNKSIYKSLLDIAAERLAGEDLIRLAVIHADAEEDAWKLATIVRERFNPSEFISSEITPVLGIHAGPDAVGIAYSSGI